MTIAVYARNTKDNHPLYLEKLATLLKKEKVSVFHLESIVDEMLSYFGKFLILLDSGKLRQN